MRLTQALLLTILDMVLLLLGIHADGEAEAAKHKGQKRAAIPAEKGSSYWLSQSLRHLQSQLTRRHITSRAKNVILFLGDGMSIPTVTAARIYRGQLQGSGPGEEAALSFDTFPWTGLSKTYCVDSQVADSACSATAYLGGVKANIGTIGVTASVKKNDCQAMMNATNHVSSVLHWAQQRGKSTGIVTTTRVTHASPAGTYAHTANRNWESDASVVAAGLDPAECPDIARQLVTNTPGRDINVILGGGRSKFLPESVNDEDGQRGDRKDSTNLIKTWEADKERRNASRTFVWDKKTLESVDTNNTDFLLGLFSASHLPYALHADADRRPSLPLMVRQAIQVLRRNPRGYFLFVEGGRIDHAHHNTEARRALHETMEFSDAVAAAVELVSEEDTLVVVTADHAHTMSFSGYPARGSDILGLAGRSDVDHLPYATLSYANGPANHDRHDLSNDHIEADDYKYPSNVPEHAETHGGEDVGVWARGPWAHLLSGVMEQSAVAAVLGHAACMGPHSQLCDSPSPNNVHEVNT